MGSINKVFRPIANLPMPANVIVGGLALIGITLLVVKILQCCWGNKNLPPKPPNVTDVFTKKSPANIAQEDDTGLHPEIFTRSAEPLTAAEKEIWTPLEPKTKKLANIFEQSIFARTSDEMTAVLIAARKGTVEELKRAIESLKDRSELTQPKLSSYSYDTPLKLAVQSQIFGKVALLIEYDTPIGAGKNGMILPDSSPLLQAATFGQDAILQLLLENGASFSVIENAAFDRVMLFDYSPTPLLYRMLEILLTGSKTPEQRDADLRCVILAMKSWRYEKGLKAIQEDKKLAKLAGDFFVNPNFVKFARLLLSYGVVQDITDQYMPSIIESSAIFGEREHLELLNEQGQLNYQEFIDHEKSLADIATAFGQFELEEFLVNQKKVAHRDREKALKKLTNSIHRDITYKVLNIDQNDDGPFSKSSWGRLMEIVDHYHVQVEDDKSVLTTPLFTACKQLSTTDEEVHRKFLLTVIEDLVKRKANLGVRFEKSSPKQQLELALQKLQGQPEITVRINAILGKTAP